MSKVQFNLKEWKKWLGDVSFEKAAQKGLLSGAMRAIPVLHRATDIAPPASNSTRATIGANNTGRFRKSWKTQRIERGVSIFNAAPYAPVVEGGRRKGAPQPPQKAIARWVQLRAGVTKEEAQRLAFVIARAIKKRGLKPRNILKNSLVPIKKVVIAEVERELRLELGSK